MILFDEITRVTQQRWQTESTHDDYPFIPRDPMRLPKHKTTYSTSILRK